LVWTTSHAGWNLQREDLATSSVLQGGVVDGLLVSDLSS